MDNCFRWELSCTQAARGTRVAMPFPVLGVLLLCASFRPELRSKPGEKTSLVEITDIAISFVSLY